MASQHLDIPLPTTLPGTDAAVPYVSVGDEAFSLSRNLMRPFPRRGLTDAQCTFNYRLSRARWEVECTFGMLIMKWQCLYHPVNLVRSVACSIVKAACVLHNFVMNTEPQHRQRNCTLDEEVPFHVPAMGHLTSIGNMNAGRPPTMAVEVWRSFMEYFTSPEGSLPFQNGSP